MKSQIKKEELIELLSERFSKHIYLENLQRKKKYLEEIIKEFEDEDFDEEDFFFGGAEDAAREDMASEEGFEDVPDLGDFESPKSFIKGIKNASEKEAEKHAKGWKGKFSKDYDDSYSDYRIGKEISSLLTKGNPSLNESKIVELRNRRREIVESLKRMYALNEAWDWSYGPEGYDAIMRNIQELEQNELVEIMTEWEVYEKVGEDASSRDFESVDKSKYEAVSHDALVQSVYEKAEAFSTSDNGDHKAWVCPYGCHTVGLHSTYEYYINLDERGEFYADVREHNGSTVFEIRGYDIFEDGFMESKDDLEGLKNHLVSMKIMHDTDKIVKGN